MKIVILQPGYLPWLGFFDQMARVDAFVLYDDVQYDKNGWRNRNRIKTPNGPQWLTVPVSVSGFPRINEVKIDNSSAWAKKHLNALQTNYSKAPYFQRYFGEISAILTERWDSLIALDSALIQYFRDVLGLQCRILVSSDLGVGGDRVDRLVQICRHLGADGYLTGGSARNYLDESKFHAHGISVEYQEYEHPVYPQLHGDFVAFLSIVDVLFNCGPKSAGIVSPLLSAGSRGHE